MKTGTREWSDAGLNVAVGCSHGCKYCYARAMAARMGRRAPEEWTREEIVENWWRKVPGGEGKVVMMPTSHDVTRRVLPTFCRAVRAVLEKRSRARSAGNRVLVVTKGNLEVMGEFLERFAGERGRIEIRVTIGSVDDGVLGFWEPGAPGLAERLGVLELAREMGYGVSVSMEPVLDGAALVTWHVVEGLADSVWIGLPNRLMSILSLNGYRRDAETWQAGRRLLRVWDEGQVRWLYEQLRGEGKVRWKDSIRQVLGLGGDEGNGQDANQVGKDGV